MASIQASHTGHTVISKITKIKTTTFMGQVLKILTQYVV